MKPAPGNKLLLVVALVFALQLTVWVAWILFASKNPVAEVPLAPATGKR